MIEPSKTIRSLSLSKFSELSPYEISKKYNIPREKIIKLDTNENFFLERGWINNLIYEILEEFDIRAYPDLSSRLAEKSIADFWNQKIEKNLNEENVIIGNGSDELINLTCRIFLDQDEKSLTSEPTFGMFKFYTSINGGKFVSVLLNNDFTLNVNKILEKVKSEKLKLLFITSPNNPTGNQFPKQEIENIIQESENCVVVLDEAYADFADYSLMHLVTEFDNLIVTRSFSKVFGMAGLRVGYLVTNEKISDYFLRVKSPYNVNFIGYFMIPKILTNWNIIEEAISKIKEEREVLYNELKKINGIMKAYESKANFILIKLTDEYNALEVQEKLMSRGIIVRYRGALPLLENCLRISVGTRDMNQQVLFNLKQILA